VSLKQIRRKTWEEFVHAFENYMALIFFSHPKCSYCITGLGDETKAWKASSQHVAKVQRTSEVSVFSCDRNGNLKRFL